MVTVKAADTPARRIPLLLRVLSFKLAESGVKYGSFFQGRFLTAAYPHNRSRWLYPENLTKIFANYREHGLNSIVLWETNPKPRYREGEIQLDLSETDTLIKAYQAAGLSNPVGLELVMLSWWCDLLATRINDSKRLGEVPATIELPFLRTSPGTPKHWDLQFTPSPALVQAYKDVIGQIVKTGQDKGWPPLFFLPQEETKHQLAKLTGYVHGSKMLKQIPGVRTALVDDSHYCGIDRGQRLDPWTDIRCYATTNETALANARKAGDELWLYNHGWSRLAFGWYVLKTGADGVFQWADQWSDVDPYGDLHERSFCWFFCYPSPTGPVPTIWSEDVREGIDDLRYVRTLQVRLDLADRSANPAAKEIAQEARGGLRSVLDQLHLGRDQLRQAVKATDPADLDVLRWRIADQITRLDGVLR